MRIAYVDTFSGAAGDMLLAALLDCGWPVSELEAVVAKLGLPGVAIEQTHVTRGGLRAVHVDVVVDPQHQKAHRHLPEIQRIITKGAFPKPVRDNALRVFERLGEAEAAVHGTTIEQVHFHEVGAADAIIDIVGFCAGLAALEVERVVCSPIPTGTGTVRCEHGVMPVPAPATARLLEGFPIAVCEEPAELTTPTGAALLTTLAERFGPVPEMRLAKTGYGAGSREGKTRPNFLRLMVGEDVGAEATTRETICVLETQVDDISGERVGFACDALLESGALDVFIVPIMMKKGRPGQLVTVLVRPEAVSDAEAILFRETGTLGVRRRWCERSVLPRGRVAVETSFGTVWVKVAELPDGGRRAAPEYEDCARLARSAGVSLAEVQRAAHDAWEQRETYDPGRKRQ